MLLPLLTAAALASGTATPKPPAPPPVDRAHLPESACFRPSAGDRPHPSMVCLIADQDAIAPGQTVRLGIFLIQDAGWHTYWKSPGDIGNPTVITWSLPDGATAPAYGFPVPQRFELEGIVSYGYEDQVLFQAPVTLPATLPPTLATVSAHVEWLACQESCIPAKADVTLPIAVSSAGSGAPGPAGNANAAVFDHYAKQLPLPSADVAPLVSTSVVVDPPTFTANKPFTATITVSPAPGHALAPVSTDAMWPAFIPIVASELFLTEQTIEALPDGGYKATLKGEALEADPVPATSVIGGLAQVTVDGKPVATEVVADVPWPAAVAPVATSGSAEGVSGGGPQTPGGTAPGGTGVVIADAAPASFGWSLFMAFCGGLLLNVMPCVLPVLTLKLYGLVEEGGHAPAEQKKAGLAYTAGVLSSFLVLALVVYMLRVGMGAQIGWGFQFQSPAYVAALGAIVFGFGLSLFGVFEIPVIGATTASEAAGKEGHAGHFFAGIFATVLGTPCSAPFLAPAVGYAFSQPGFFTMALFFCTIGLGLALPFLIVSFVPRLFAFMPQPGAWMETFKKLMGFTLVATAVWLAGVFGALVGPAGGVGYLWFLLAISVGGFVFGHWGSAAESYSRQASAALVGVAIAAVGGYQFLELQVPPAEAACATDIKLSGLDYGDEVPWQSFSEQAVASSAGHPVFIDFTAEWCLTCKVTEKTVIETRAVRDAMRINGVIPLKADWTRYDPVITEWLARHGRAGVPFWLVIPADRSQPEIVLPDAMTQSMLIEALDAAR